MVTDGILRTCREWTGDEPIGCPWSAYRDPFVGRVLTAFRAYKEGQLRTLVPHPSYRLVQGVMHYDYVNERATATRLELKRLERERAGGAS